MTNPRGARFIEAEWSRFSMTTHLDLTEKKKCPVCGSDAYRIESLDYGKRTYYAFEEAEMIDVATNKARPAGTTILLRGYGCSNRACGHVDFYSHLVSEDSQE